MSGFASTIDVIAYSRITVAQSRERQGYRGRSHSLWFCDAQDERVYRWFELAFMPSLYTGTILRIPFDQEPSRDVAPAFGMGGGNFQLARPPAPIDQGEESIFVEQWLTWLAEASDNALETPRNLPEPSKGRYRPLVRS